ncbi:caspase family protein, partial (plasmid) [Phormidium sp. CLA17]
MGQNWAIAIGINNYDNLQALSYAKRDAEAMRDYYRNEIGFEQVYYFAEGAPDIELEHGPPFKPLPTFAKLDRFLD